VARRAMTSPKRQVVSSKPVPRSVGEPPLTVRRRFA
jgi:hypothetical protein